MTTNDKIADKVRKLLAKANGTNNEAEAAAFAAKAQALMVEHNLQMSDVEMKEEALIGVEHLRFEFKDNYPWTRQLASAVAGYYMCGFYYMGRTNTFVLLGRPSRTEVAKMMFEYLFTTSRRLGRAYSNVGSIRNAFERGCGIGLANRLRVLTAKAKGEPDKSGLPALYQGAEAEIADFMNTLRRKSSVSKTGVGFHAGQSAANNVSLNTQVGGSRSNNGHGLAARSSGLFIGRG